MTEKLNSDIYTKSNSSDKSSKMLVLNNDCTATITKTNNEAKVNNQYQQTVLNIISLMQRHP